MYDPLQKDMVGALSVAGSMAEIADRPDADVAGFYWRPKDGRWVGPFDTSELAASDAATTLQPPPEGGAMDVEA